MYRLIATVLFCGTSLSGAFAAEIDFSSGIEKVLVFPQGAQVTRLASGEVPQGDHVIIVDDLPGNVLPDSIRVKGMADGSLVQNSVDVRQLSVREGDQPEERKRLNRKITELQFEKMALTRHYNDLGLQRKLLESLANRSISGPGDEDGKGIAASSLEGLFETVGNRLAKLQQGENETLIRQREIDMEIVDLQKQISELAPKNRTQTIVQINVAAKDAAKAAFEIEYKVNEAGWKPVYDARLNIGDKGGDDVKSAGLDLVRRASVYQRTGESWNDITLSLSTARPSSATTAPGLSPYEIDVRPEPPQPAPLVKNRAKIQNFGTSGDLMSLQAESRLADEVVEEAEVVTEVAGFQAVFQIPGVTSVENTGEMKSVTIDRFEIDAQVYALTVPRLDLSAYLMAGFTHEGETPLLPGPVSLSRDGIFIGRGRMPLIAAGERHEMGFGVDDQIIVERVETSKEKGEGGFVSKVNTDLRTFRTTLTNRHNFELPVRVRDRLPVSNQEDIVVEMTAGSTKPDRSNVNDLRGILEWSKDVAAGEEWVIDFGYEVTWPEAMKISRID